jgi:DNA-binding MurR/RpiR family transcriptional regulator
LVRRFGFESYDDFLDEMHGFMDQDLAVTLQVSQAQRALLVKDSSRFLDGYIDDICASLVQLKELVSQVDVDELIERSFAGETAFFATDKPLSMARDLQTAYLLAGKLVQVGETKQKRRQIASELPAGSLAIVFSNYGRYVDGNRSMLEEMRRRGVMLWLVTLCYDGPNVLLFDKIISLSRGGYTSVGGFPMRVFVEFVVRRMLLGKG